MTTPNSTSFTNPNPTPPPIPTPLPASNNSAESLDTGSVVSHTIIPPPPANQGEAFLKRNKLVMTATGGAVSSGIAGRAVHIEGKKYNHTKNLFYNQIYEKCRTDNSYSKEDAIFELKTTGFSDTEILDLLTSSCRIPPLQEGQKNAITMVNGRRTVTTTQCETEEAKELPPHPGDSYSSNMSIARIDMNDGSQNFIGDNTKQVIQGGQLLILNSKDCDSEALDMPENEQLQYVCVDASPPALPGNPNSNYPQRYTVLVILFGGLAGLFLILCFKFINLKQENEYVDDPEILNNANFPKPLNKKVDNNLITILLKSHQKSLSSEETRALLIKECALSETTINEILKNM